MRWLAWWVVASGCSLGSRSQVDVPVWAGGTGLIPEGVTLTEASVTFSDLRLEEPAAVAWLDRWSPISTAVAHPGHDYPGDVGGELLGTFTLDLLAPDVKLGDAACYTGAYATGRVSLAGTAAILAGEHLGEPFRFEIAADQDIVGIPFDVELTEQAPFGAIELRFDPASALAYVDWSAPDTWANAALFGVVATPTWSLTIR